MPRHAGLLLKAAAQRTPAARIAAREAPASQHIPYVRHADAWTLETRSGDWVQVLHLEGKSFDTEDARELDRLKATRNTFLRALAGGEYALWQHIVRRRVHPELSPAVGDGFAGELDRKWFARLRERRLYVNDLYLSLVRRAPRGAASIATRLQRAISPRRDRKQHERERAQALRELHQQTENLQAKLAPYAARRLGVTDTALGPHSELLRFVLHLLTGRDRPVLLPTVALDRFVGSLLPAASLDTYLPASADHLGGEAFEMRGPAWSRFGAVLAIKEYAAQTQAGMLDALFTLPCEAIVTQSFAFIGRGAALEALARQARIMENIDDPALSQIDEIEEARDDLASGRLVYGSHHFSVVPIVEDAAELDRACNEADKRLTDLGLIVVRESGGAMELARWAQLPGNFAYVARPAPISSLNFAAFASLHNYAYGKPGGNHWGPAITILETVSGTPYFFNFHDADIGNTLVVGASGTGKTTVMGFLLAQARRTGARILYFDKDRGADLLVRALGGRYSVIRQGQPTGFNPLRLPDSAATRAFLANWLATLLTARGERLTAQESQLVQQAVDDTFRLPDAQRRLAIIAAFVPRISAGGLAERLQPWHGSGQYAWLFDNEEDRLALDAAVMGFDLTDVLRDPVIRVPALYYLLQRVDRVLAAGTPTIIVIDEGWAALADPVFAGLVEDWERTIRKRGGLVMFASQSPESITRNPVGSVIVSQSPTHIFMPNPKSEARAFEGYNLTQRELELILTLDKESRCFLIKHGRHSVVAKLDLAGMDDEVAILSGRQDTVELLDRIIAETGDDPAAWMPVFHRRRKQP
ncbi:VirB4 family type IV secretion/conjugal transfer ATPase [Hydrocarboniphaga sp.]|jgi:type IV secretion system protein VirB4|uniref:VirB4 family type IV secretion/conjugal transfer ATPase n=1 Tax=Hydrocarboniphaga sp. TaxID=2033016 RepID=UPI002ABAAF6F|nr:VirB4 family type IV secretion/conjugal transfer ATPase [Hydrocarboniphaga sp.]MDZ4078499.1 VirB4 family type IV secretion/conjugal transfer ATPase [Hydrocarboniphaga sp.]